MSFDSKKSAVQQCKLPNVNQKDVEKSACFADFKYIHLHQSTLHLHFKPMKKALPLHFECVVVFMCNVK